MQRSLEPLFITTENNYTYIFSPGNKRLFYVHPLLFYFLKNGIKSVVNESPFKYKNKIYTKEEYEYYLSKYLFFKKHNLIAHLNTEKKFFDEFSYENINQSIINTEQIAIEVIQDCNLKCKYCLYGDLYKTNFKYNSIDAYKVKKIIKYLFLNYWKEKRQLKSPIKINFYGGEPLLKFNLIKEITEYVKNLSPEIIFNFGITTNGTLLTKEIVDFFIENSFVVAISIDGNKYNNSYRISKNGKEIHNILHKNILSIRDLSPEYFYKYIHFISVLHNRNSEEEVKKYLTQEFGSVPSHIGPLNTIDIKDKKEFDLVYKPFKTKTELILKNKKYNIQKEFYKIHSTYSSFKKSVLPDSKKFYTGTCIPLHKKIFITADYRIMPCEKISFDIDFGKISFIEQDDQEATIDFTTLLNTHNKHYKKTTHLCKKCYYNELCRNCIYDLKNKQGETCPHFLGKSQMIDYLKQILNYYEENNTI